MKDYKKAIITTLCVAAFTCGTASASVVLIDWSDARTQPSPDTNGNQWNILGTSAAVSTSLAATALTNTTGASSGWSVAVTFQGGNNAGWGGTGINGPIGGYPFDTTGTDRATVDGIFSNGGPSSTPTITFTGLDASFKYDFSLIGGRTTGDASSGGTIAVTTGTGATGGSLPNDGTLLDFTLTPDAGGVIAFTFTDTDSADTVNSATFNAMSITAVVPEPSTAVLLVLGGLAACGFYRSRKKLA